MRPIRFVAPLALLASALTGCGADEMPRDTGRSGKADVPYTGRACYDRSARGEPWQDYSMHRCVDIQQPGFAASECDGHTVKGYCHGGNNIRCCVQPTPQCGDGRLEGTEECDGSELGSQTCQTQGYAGGALGCDAQCRLDTSACTATLPIGGAFGDRCGGAHGGCLPSLTCVIVNESGDDEGFCTQACSLSTPCPTSPANAECIFQLSSGQKLCGFRCDPGDPNPCPAEMTCSERGQGYACTTDEPPVCGDGQLEGTEQCDGAELNNLSCQSFGYAGGTLACDSACALDKSGCQGSSACNLPPLHCTAGNAACSELEQLSPAQGDGYLMGHPAEWSWGRHDLFITTKHAAASVACLMPGSLPIHTFDVSMQDGSVPKSDVYTGSPCDQLGATCRLRHPQGTHTGGNDIDMSYYQTQGMANPGAVCPHTVGGREAYHCTGAPTILDAPRTALFLGKLLESSRIRVIGVDGKVGPLIETEAQKLLQQGLISSAAHAKLLSRVAYEPTDTGRGWFLHHHHHFHVSLITSPYPSPMMPGATPEPSDWLEPAPNTDHESSDLSSLQLHIVDRTRWTDASTAPRVDLDLLAPRYRRPLDNPIRVHRLGRSPTD